MQLSSLVGKSEHLIINSEDFINKISDIQLSDDENDVSALFTCVPPTEAVDVVRELLEKDKTWRVLFKCVIFLNFV